MCDSTVANCSIFLPGKKKLHLLLCFNMYSLADGA